MSLARFPLSAFASAVAFSAGLLFASACSGDDPAPTDEGSSSGASGTLGGASSGSTQSAPGTSGTPGSSSGTSGTSGLPGSSSGTSGMTGGDPVANCISACEAKYPKGTQLGQGIDACWNKSCSKQCNGIGAGQPKGPKNGSCQTEVSTPSADCSQCTVDKCCQAWDACFKNADCSALNTCSIACYK